MILRAYIGDDPQPREGDFETMDSKEAGELFDEAVRTAEVGDTLYVVAVAVEEGP